MNGRVLFQFPSNGKAYPKTLTPSARLKKKKPMFQFPSNGKAYPKFSVIEMRRRLMFCVSIPFKRESVSKVKDIRDVIRTQVCFNSLQTGKRIQRLYLKMRTISCIMASFNSLQTGKRIQSITSTSTVGDDGAMFQFPSNGKAYPKRSKSGE